MSDDQITSPTESVVPKLGVFLNRASFIAVLASWCAVFFGMKRGFLVSYGGDLFGSILLYTSIRQDTKWLGEIRWLGPTQVAGFVFIGCTAFELAQHQHWVPGWYDPLDIVCYAIGVILCFYLDQRIIPSLRHRKAHPSLRRRMT